MSHHPPSARPASRLRALPGSFLARVAKTPARVHELRARHGPPTFLSGKLGPVPARRASTTKVAARNRGVECLRTVKSAFHAPGLARGGLG